MSIPRHAIPALLLAGLVLVAGVVAWGGGTVDLGFELREDGGEVVVSSVQPEGIAARSYWWPGSVVTWLQVRGERVPLGSPQPLAYDEGTIRLPTEAYPESMVTVLEIGYRTEEFDGAVQLGGPSLERATWEMRLGASLWIVLLGLVMGAGAWLALARGLLGDEWRREGASFGVAVAVPFLAVPVAYTGTLPGMLAAYVLPTAAALPVAWAFASRHPDAGWRPVLVGAAVLSAMLAVTLAVRGLTTTVLGDGGERYGTFFMMGAVALVPALGLAFAGDRGWRERLEIGTLGAVPGAAMLVLVPLFPDVALPLIGVVALIGWRLLPLDPLVEWLGTTGERLRASADASDAAAAAPVDPARSAQRVTGSILIAGATLFASVLVGYDTWAVLIGLALGAAVAYAVARGLLGPGWTDAAVPLGVAVGVPVMAGALNTGSMTAEAVRFILATGAALPVAHLIADRHPVPAARSRVFGAALLVAVMAALLVVTGSGQGMSRYVLMGSVALVPGLLLAFRTGGEATERVADRLDTLVVATTPGVAMTTMVGSPNPWLLLLWLGGVVAWRRFSFTPLVGLAVRTQRQRDLAVAAAEAERARLAADLHDDALQELTGLVRRLDAAGDSEGAELARGVAERLRAICSDLRLPLLDDLGAGPALEWLVSRIRPMAGGDVRLERSESEQRPPSGVELAVFRVAQEALSNAVRHGRPPITIRYHVDDGGGVSLSVDDAGPGIQPGAPDAALAAGHFGVANMQQRAEQIGGLLDIRRWPGGGTHVALEWRPQ